MSLEAETEFSFKLMLNLNAHVESKVCLPASILNSLTMIYIESKGKTADQITKILGKDKSREDIIQYYSNFVERHNSQLNTNTKSENICKKSNSRKRSHSHEDIDDEGVKLSKIINLNFDGQIQQFNFDDTDSAVKEINLFVKNATKNMIKKILSPSDIEPQTSLIIVNAVHFLGFWDKPFEERQKQKFYSSNLSILREIDMINYSVKDDEQWNLREGDDWQCLGIPYKNKMAYIFIILTKENDGLEKLLKKMNYEFFKNITTKQICGRLNVTIPVMEIETLFDLKQELYNLGITNLFDKNSDLTGMLPGSHEIGKAVHKAVIKVDERGTEAAAVTAWIAQDRSSNIPPSFEADHPFLYFISTMQQQPRSMTPQEILFMGTFC